MKRGIFFFFLSICCLSVYTQQRTKIYLSSKLPQGTTIIDDDIFDVADAMYIVDVECNMNGKTISIPDGCILYFQGGSISNAVIEGSFEIVSPKYGILKDVIAKDITNSEVPIEWFGGYAYRSWNECKKGKLNTTEALENAVQTNAERKIIFSNGFYRITKTIELNNNVVISGNNHFCRNWGIKNEKNDYALNTKLYFTSKDSVLFYINTNFTQIRDISLHGNIEKIAIQLDKGYRLNMDNVQMYVWKYGIYRKWDNESLTGIGGSEIKNCAFGEMVGGIFMDYNKTQTGKNLYYYINNRIDNTIFTQMRSFAVFIKSNFSIEDNIFDRCVFEKIGFGKYDNKTYETFGCFAVQMNSFYKGSMNGGNSIINCYFENIIPFFNLKTSTSKQAKMLTESNLLDGKIIPKDDSKYFANKFYNTNVEFNNTYFTNVLKFLEIDQNTSVSINNCRIYSFHDIYKNSFWKYNSLITMKQNELDNSKFYSPRISYINAWPISKASPLNSLVSFEKNEMKNKTNVVNAYEVKFLDYVPLFINSSINDVLLNKAD